MKHTACLLLPALVLLAGADDPVKSKKESPNTISPVRFTVRTERGEQSGLTREPVLKTTELSADQLLTWAQDPRAAKEERSTSVFRAGHVETVVRNASGDLVYGIRDPGFTRTSHNRSSVLKTRKMTAEQLKAWVSAPEGKSEGRTLVAQPGSGALITVSNAKGSVTGRDRNSVSKAASLDSDQMREWAADPKAAKEGRMAVIFGSGHVEIIWRDPDGQLLYAVRNDQGSRTGRVRDNVQKTLSMEPQQVQEWVEDTRAARERRCAATYQSGYVELISRGQPVEPPQN